MNYEPHPIVTYVYVLGRSPMEALDNYKKGSTYDDRHEAVTVMIARADLNEGRWDVYKVSVKVEFEV